MLDTWFSSALWPFSTLGWPDTTPALKQVLPDQRAGHGLRHHLLLGRPHDHDGPQVHGRRAVQATSTSPGSSATRTATRCRSPRATSSTRWTSSTASRSTTWSPSAPPASCSRISRTGIEKATRKQFPGGHRRLRHRRAALHVRLARRPVARHQLRPRPRGRLPQLLQQAVERRALRADDDRRRRQASGDLSRRRGTLRRRSLDRLALRRDARAGR